VTRFEFSLGKEQRKNQMRKGLVVQAHWGFPQRCEMRRTLSMRKGRGKSPATSFDQGREENFLGQWAHRLREGSRVRVRRRGPEPIRTIGKKQELLDGQRGKSEKICDSTRKKGNRPMLAGAHSDQIENRTNAQKE